MRRITRQSDTTIAIIPRPGPPFSEPVTPEGRIESDGQVRGTERLGQLLGPVGPFLLHLIGVSRD